MATVTHPTPHGDKLHALLENSNLPLADRPSLERAIMNYDLWLKEIQDIQGEGQFIEDAVEQTLPLAQVEKSYIRRVLEKLGGNKYQTAQVLGIDRKTLYRKLSEIEEEKSEESGVRV